MPKCILLAAVVVLTCASFGPDLFAQSSQTVTPVPMIPPSVNTTTLTCQINCDTQAMNYMNNSDHRTECERCGCRQLCGGQPILQ